MNAALRRPGPLLSPRGKLLVLAAVLCTLPVASQARFPETHDKGWWRAIAANDFAPPPEESLQSLVLELNGYLASPDPELRDDTAYNVLTQWLYVQQIVPPDMRSDLIDTWRGNLARGIGQECSDSVFLRSFSALMLSVAAALDNEAPYLDGAGFDRLLDSALTYLRDERDTRGFEAGKGWLHSVAHTADLLKFLGRSRHLETREQAAILTAIADKLDALDHVLVHGEDERLARAVVSIVARTDVDMASFEAFLQRLKPERTAGLPTPAALAADQNSRNLAVSLYAVLNTDPRELESLQEGESMLLALLDTML